MSSAASAPRILALALAYVALGAAAAVGCKEPKPAGSALSWSSDSTGPARFLAVHGRRAALFGYPEGGLEAWVYPIQALSGLRVAFRQRDASSEIDGQSILRRIDYTPEAVTRIYTGPDFVVREHLFVPLDASGIVVSYECQGVRPVDVVVRFVPVLDLMWPAGIGGQEVIWDAGARAYLLSEPTHRFAASVGSPETIAHDDTVNVTRRAGRPAGLSLTLRPAPASRSVRLVIAGGATLAAEDAAAARILLEQSQALESAAQAHYRDVLADGLEIETPDPQVNRALDWAQVALDQAWVCNPDFGCGLVAGYGPSRKARRPQYDWFFAGDGMMSVHALLASGRYARAREELEFILKYQDQASGMIWHELVQGAASIDWKKYPFMFVHVDLSFDFLNTVAEYLATTGDTDFVRRHWNALAAAYRYCRTLLDPKDGLPRIPSDKQGNNEQDALSDDLALSASWVSATRAFSTLAQASGHAALASSANAASDSARRAVRQRYWDERGHFWISAYTRSGAPVTDHDTRPAAALDEALLTPEQRDAVLDELASADFQADWGSRSMAASAARYDPNSYAGGSVWGLGTAGVASAFFGAHRPATALPIWNALVGWSALDSLGHMHEVLAGDYYHEEQESVPEQSWSSAALISSAVKGLLGLEVDGSAHRLSFAPHLPADWNALTLRHLRVAASELTLVLSQADDELRLNVHNEGGPIGMTFAPLLPLGAAPIGAQLQGQPLAVQAEAHAQDSHARMQFEVPHGDAVVTLAYRGGVAVVPPRAVPAVGAPSTALKIVSTTLAGRELRVAFDRVPSQPASLELRTSWRIEDVQGATLEKSGPNPQLQLAASAGAPAGYQRGELTVRFSRD